MILFSGCETPVGFWPVVPDPAKRVPRRDHLATVERRCTLSVSGIHMYKRDYRQQGEPQSLKASISATSLAASVVRTMGLVSSTYTLSSMRTPIPRK